MDKLDVQIVHNDGDKFAMLPWDQFQELLTQLDDALDLADMRQAKIENGNEPGITLGELKRRLGLEDRANESAA